MAGFVPGLIGPHMRRAVPVRRRWSWARLAGPVAAAAGTTLRLVAAGGRFAPGIGAGVAFVVAGFVLAPWAGWAALGTVLLALDRRTNRTEADA